MQYIPKWEYIQATSSDNNYIMCLQAITINLASHCRTLSDGIIALTVL